MLWFQFTADPFKGRDGETEVTLEGLNKYMENMERIFQLNRRMNTVTGNLVDFDDESK